MYTFKARLLSVFTLTCLLVMLSTSYAKAQNIHYADARSGVALAPVTAGVYDDTNSHWVYTGAWTAYTGPGPASNTMHYTSTAGNSAQLDFNGIRFTLTFTKHTNRGSIDVFVDAVYVTTINANAATIQWQQTYTSPIYPAGNHTVRLVHAGGGAYIDVDAIQIINAVPVGAYDDANSNWAYTGSWTAYTDSGPACNTIHYTSTVGDYAELSFTGAKFILTFTKHSNRGSIDVFVDGVLVTTINANNATLTWQQTWTSPTYPAGIHTVKLVHAGGGAYIDIDLIRIYGAPVPLSAGMYDDTNINWIYSGAWTAYTDSGPANNTMHYTSTVGDYAELEFSGTEFTLTFTKYTNRGSIDVFVDAVYVTTINASNPTLAWQQTYTSPAYTSGNHTLRLVHAGGGVYIDVDAIQIYGSLPPGTYDDTNSWVYSGAWTAYTGGGPANNTMHYTSTVGDYAELPFNGTGFTLTFTKYTNRGLIDVFVDAVYVTTINASNPTLAWQQTWTSPTYTLGAHTVRLVHGGGGMYIDVDALTVLP